MATLLTQESTSVWNGAALNRLNQQAATLFRQFQDTPGVRNMILCDNRGKTLGAYLNDNYDRAFLNGVGLCVAQIFAALEKRGAKSTEMELKLEHANLFVRDLGDAFSVVICTPSTSWSLIRMAMNVSADTFQADTELQKSLRTAAMSRRDTLSQTNLAEETWQLARQAGLVG